METLIKEIVKHVYKRKLSCIDCNYFDVVDKEYCVGCSLQNFNPKEEYIESFAKEILLKISADNNFKNTDL